ncbi:MAG: hypothetical protein AB1411_13290 [Nitrospirota bacterium]
MLVTTAEEFDRVATEALPELLDRATAQTRRFLRETGQWQEDVAHEKLALRWGYDLVERFLACGRSEVPCRPFLLLESLVTKYFSQPEPLCYHKDLLSPLGRFLDGLASRAVISRDALIALFYHFYGLGQGQVARLLGLGSVESQRVYKNFERWRRTGWQRTIEEIGLTDQDLQEIETQKQQHPDRLKGEAERLLLVVQTHYRKSEPQHFPCRSREEWADLFKEGYGLDYRIWHLAMCRNCLLEVHALRTDGTERRPAPQVDLHVRPLVKGRFLTLVLGETGGNNGNETGRRAQHLSGTSA